MSTRFWVRCQRAGAGACVLLGFLAAGCKGEKAPPPPPPPAVQVMTVGRTNFPVFEEWVGTLQGFINAQIRAQVTGYLLQQDYAEGSRVQKGQLLFQIDPRPFKAALDQALGKLAQDKAQEAKNHLDVQRYAPLAKEQALSEETLVNAQQAYAASRAQVQADEAAVALARLNVGFTRITSPIDGLAGTALAQIGDLVGPSGPVLTTISTIDPIRVYFQVNEKSYLTYWRHLASLPNTNTNTTVPLELILWDGSHYPWKGKFFYAGREVNPTTGALMIAGLFPNPNYELRPGQYGLVRAQTHVITNAVLVPQRAVTQLQGTFQVAVVGPDNTVAIQRVKLGPQAGTNWVVESGLNAGERVVVEGTQKVRPGERVNPEPPTAPPFGNSMATSAP